jgi:hypothetical protein
MYLWAGAPAKTATVVRAAMTLFTNGPDGMTGNDDLGTMSAWYVFSSLGLYPTMSGGDFLAVSSPQFSSAVVRIGTYGEEQGGTLTIKAPGASDTTRYIQRSTFDGRDLRRTWLDWDAVAHGGTLAHQLGDEPSSWGTGRSAEPPSVNRAAADSRTRLDASLRAGSDVVPQGDTPQTAHLALDVLGQAPGALRVTVRARAPEGWEVRMPSSFTLDSRRLPVQRTVEAEVSVPAGTAPGSYPVRIEVTGTGVGSVAREATVEVREPNRCATATGGQCAVDLAREANHDGTATVAASDEGDFDGGGWSYDAALLPKAGPVTWDGVTYQAPDASGTAANFTEARGQSMLLPPGAEPAQSRTLRLVAAAHNGTVSTTLTVRYTDGTSAELPVTVGDWAGSAPGGSTVALDMDHRIRRGQGVDGPSVRLFATSAPLEAAKTVRSLSLPDDPRVEVYALTLV